MRDVFDGKAEEPDGLDVKGKIRDFEDDFPVSSLEKGFNCVPSEDVDIQIPGTCGHDLIWK